MNKLQLRIMLTICFIQLTGLWAWLAITLGVREDPLVVLPVLLAIACGIGILVSAITLWCDIGEYQDD